MHANNSDIQDIAITHHTMIGKVTYYVLINTNIFQKNIFVLNYSNSYRKLKIA